jgi:NTP pyrophosphatase (non-canonical NTP hydrolase)
VEHFNKLSPEIQELLAVLAEECGEVVQRVGKILRHGLRDNPYNGLSNAAQLESELTDVYTLMHLLSTHGVINLERLKQNVSGKMGRLGRPGMLHHSTVITTSPCAICGSTERRQVDGPGGPNGRGVCADPRVCTDMGMNGM